MRQVFCVLLALVLTLGLVCMGFAEADKPETFVSGDYEYIPLEDGSAEIVKYSGIEDNPVIPPEIDGKKVTTIGNLAFFLCHYPTSVTIPDSVTRIGKDAFFGCKSLVSVTIPDSVTEIENNPFGECSSLIEIVVSPDHPTLAVIDQVLFSKPDKRLVCHPCGLTATEYTIPQDVQIIADSAFSGCEFLTSITIPDSVTSIGEWAFSSCRSLTSITVPDSVASIECGAFADCDSLTAISIPDSVTSIGERAFAGCLSLTSVTVPDSVTGIGKDAFSRCPATLTVGKDSYAQQYCVDNNLPYTCPD